MASHRLPRRTRVYDANYNIGQSYYKPALDNLDRKYYGRSNGSAPISPPRTVSFDLEDKYDDVSKAARTRAARAIAEEAVFDSRGIRSRKGAPISSIFDDDIDEDVKESLTRIQAAKKQIAATINDFEAEDTLSSLKRRGDSARKYLDMAEEDDFKSKLRSRKPLEMNGDDDFKPKSRARRLLDTNGDDDTSTAPRSRAFKALTRFDDESSTNASSISSSFKRVAISDSVETGNSAASMRAKASKARLADIETEMNTRSERLLERERRAANLKKILADSEMEAITAN